MTTAEARDDLRLLGGIDKRHRFLADVPDRWFQNKGYTALSARHADGTPLVGVLLQYPSVCPIDPTAEMQIKYWVGNLDRRAELLPAFIANIVAINTEMGHLGVARVWGLVPKTADHLVGFLDDVAAAGACVRTDGAGVSLDASAESDYRNFYFYVGERETVTRFLMGAR